MLDWLSFAGPIGGQTLDSALGVGTSETFQSPLVDAHTSLDNGFGLDDQEFFFDDYTYPDSELALQAYGEIAVTSHSLHTSITHQPSFPSDLQSSGSSSTSFPHIQDSLRLCCPNQQPRIIEESISHFEVITGISHQARHITFFVLQMSRLPKDLSI